MAKKPTRKTNTTTKSSTTTAQATKPTKATGTAGKSGATKTIKPAKPVEVKVQAAKPKATRQTTVKKTVKPAEPTTESAAMPEVAMALTHELTHDQIANRAYQIWLAKGRPIGHDQTIWQQAEDELKTGM